MIMVMRLSVIIGSVLRLLSHRACWNRSTSNSSQTPSTKPGSSLTRIREGTAGDSRFQRGRGPPPHIDTSDQPLPDPHTRTQRRTTTSPEQHISEKPPDRSIDRGEPG